jgi:hypothetical protein
LGAFLKLIIAGSRSFHDIGFVYSRLLDYDLTPSEILSGGAPGVDASAEWIARDLGIPVKVFPADWQTHGRSAGPRRNREMAEYGDALLAIWDGKSPGTGHMIKVMTSLGKPVYVGYIPK